MNVHEGYNQWASRYDGSLNKTRDLEAVSLKEALCGQQFNRILEIGCGTGKNSKWLSNISGELTSVDLSEEMLKIARKKTDSPNVKFIQADILDEWHFTSDLYDLITFSLILEHIEDLAPVFTRAAAHLTSTGVIYIGELHPFKQYSGSKARFETESGTITVKCYNHHISDFTNAASRAGLKIESIAEHFDDGIRQTIPRILSMLLRKSNG